MGVSLRIDYGITKTNEIYYDSFRYIENYP